MAYTPVPSTQTIRFPTLSRVGPRGSVRVVLPWQMRKESARLATFKDWTPGQHGSPSPQVDIEIPLFNTHLLKSKYRII